MLFGTFVRQTTLSVTFGKRRRSIPVGLLDRIFDHSSHASRPRTPKRRRNGSAERRFGAPSSPEMPSGLYFGTPAVTSRPPVKYLP